MKLLRLNFLDNLKVKYSDEYTVAEGEDKVRVNNILKKISQTRSELSKLAPDKAFPKSEAEIIEFKKQTNAK